MGEHHASDGNAFASHGDMEAEAPSPVLGDLTNEATFNLGAKRGRRPHMDRTPSAELVRRAFGVQPSSDPPIPPGRTLETLLSYTGMVRGSRDLDGWSSISARILSESGTPTFAAASAGTPCATCGNTLGGRSLASRIPLC